MKRDKESQTSLDFFGPSQEVLALARDFNDLSQQFYDMAAEAVDAESATAYAASLCQAMQPILDYAVKAHREHEALRCALFLKNKAHERLLAEYHAALSRVQTQEKLMVRLQKEAHNINVPQQADDSSLNSLLEIPR